MQVSSAISGMKESATLAVSAKAAALKAKGVDVVGFGVGEPDFDTPEPIKRAAIRALEAGQTKYAPTPGDRAAREAIAHKHRTENGIDCSFEHVTITAGAKHAIYLALQVLIERGAGDEVIVPTPAWVSYRPLVELAGARCVEVPARVEDGLVVRPEAIELSMTSTTLRPPGPAFCPTPSSGRPSASASIESAETRRALVSESDPVRANIPATAQLMSGGLLA